MGYLDNLSHAFITLHPACEDMIGIQRACWLTFTCTLSLTPQTRRLWSNAKKKIVFLCDRCKKKKSVIQLQRKMGGHFLSQCFSWLLHSVGNTIKKRSDASWPVTKAGGLQFTASTDLAVYSRAQTMGDHKQLIDAVKNCREKTITSNCENKNRRKKTNNKPAVYARNNF